MSLPDTWHDLEAKCKSSGGGHLVSLDHYEVEEALAHKTNLSHFWTGGNMCSDSPGETRTRDLCTSRSLTTFLSF